MIIITYILCFRSHFHRNLIVTIVKSLKGAISYKWVLKRHQSKCSLTLLQVSWVHRRQGQTALQLLTVGKQTYSGDARYTIDFQYPNNWRLKIESVIKDDEGVYECQVSTHPPRIITYHLHVNGKSLSKIDINRYLYKLIPSYSLR